MLLARSSRDTGNDDDAPGRTARPTPTPVPARETWRVRCGGESTRDASGAEWLEDQGYEGGETAFTDRPIQAAKDAVLYQSERWGADFGYVLPVPKGKYMFGIARVGEKGQIVIPKKARDVFSIKPGDSLMVLGDEGSGLALLPFEKFKTLFFKAIENDPGFFAKLMDTDEEGDKA